MKFLDLFSGIGGFRLGMEKAGHECLGYCEIDEQARKSYQSIFNTKGEWTAHDIRTVSNEEIRSIGRVDVICGGFPCQTFSIAGKRKGFADTRGTLFFEIMRFASILRPRYLFCENVPGLLNHEGGDTFETILRAMDEIGYDAEWDCLNSKDFGVPQNRERVFIIGHLRGERTRKVFPFGEASADSKKSGIKDVVKIDRPVKIGNIYGNKSQNGNYYDPFSISPTLSTNDGYACLLMVPSVRKLTPNECWRLQGFPDWAFKRAQAVNNDAQLYKQAGNSVTVNVIQAIAERL